MIIHLNQEDVPAHEIRAQRSVDWERVTTPSSSPPQLLRKVDQMRYIVPLIFEGVSNDSTRRRDLR